jgi:hypothetical protein
MEQKYNYNLWKIIFKFFNIWYYIF